MNYTQIKLHRADLDSYSDSDIFTLQRYYGIPVTGSRNDLLWLIANAIYMHSKQMQSAQMPNDLFGVYHMQVGTNLYHGTHNRLIGNKPRAPGYYSPDPLQSIGHTMRDFKELVNASVEGDDTLVNKKISDLGCLPLVYQYQVGVHGLNLLQLNTPFKSITFEKLLDTNLLTKMVTDMRVKKGFIAKVKALGSTIKSEDTFETILTKYQRSCINSCFGGWANTPGYYLLSNIDYNLYFQTIGILGDGQYVDGLYIPLDQDEVVLFDATNIINTNTSVILPYRYMNSLAVVATNFVRQYISASPTIKIEIAKDYNSVDDNVWNFSWFMTDLYDFNPLATSGWEFRFDINDFMQRIEHGQNVRSSKLSIADIEQLSEKLRAYIETILNEWTVGKLGINLEKVCENVREFDRAVVYQ